MFNNKGLPNSSNWSYSGRIPKLPPRSPFPSTNQVVVDSGTVTPHGKKHTLLPNDNLKQHQRTSSESFLIEDQPSWLDDLLNEPETPYGKGVHRRSSSDSLAYLDTSNISEVSPYDSSTGDRFVFLPFHVSIPFDMHKDASHVSFDICSTNMSKTRGWDPSLNSMRHQSYVASVEDVSVLANNRHSSIQENMEPLITAMPEYKKSNDNDCKQCAQRRDSTLIRVPTSDVDQCDKKECFDRKEGTSNDKPTIGDADPKRTKQHFAQRSRVRKLQYIAELERVVNALHAEGSDAAAEFSFLKQQHLILTLENRALVQRINTIAHEKQIKDVEYELLRKEVDRLREVYCNQRNEMLEPQQCGDAATNGADNLDLQLRCFSLNPLNHFPTGSAKEHGVVNRVAPYPCMMLQKS